MGNDAQEYGAWTSEDVDRNFEHPDDVLRAGLKALGFRDRITGSVRDAAEYYYTLGDFVYSHAGIEAYKDAMHRAAVEYAMRKEGKTVHAVIAGYPDLSEPEGPEAELRAMWTAKGVPEERQTKSWPTSPPKPNPALKWARSKLAKSRFLRVPQPIPMRRPGKPTKKALATPTANFATQRCSQECQ